MTTENQGSSSTQVIEQARCQAQLVQLMNLQAGVIAATVSTTDGFEVASIALNDNAHAGKLAAITSSLQALGDAAAQELGLSTLQSVTIETTGGRMFSVAVKLPKRTLILAVIASKNTLYAHSLFATRECAASIAADLSGMGMPGSQAAASNLFSTP